MVLLTFMFSGWFVLSVLLNAFILGIVVFLIIEHEIEPIELFGGWFLFVVVCLLGFMFVKSWLCILHGL